MSQPQPQPLLVVQASQVYGLSIPNAEAASLTRKVIRVSLILMMLQIAYSFYNVFALDQSEFMTGTFLSLLVPLCGYFGAKYRKRGLVIAFSMCNCLTAVFMPISLGVIGFAMHYLHKNLPTICPNGPSGMPEWNNATGSVQINGRQITCQELYELTNQSSTVFAFLIPVGILATIIACLSCSWGFKLANTRYFTVPVTQFRTGAVATVATPSYAAPQQGYAVGTATVVSQQPRQDKSVPAIIIA